MENYTVCNCKQVKYSDILDAVHSLNNISDVLAVFEEVQKITHCSTGCGGCHDKIIAIISDAMYGYETTKPTDSCKF